MPKTIANYYRELIVNQIFSTKTVNNCWPFWVQRIKEIIGNNPSEMDILNLGDHLSEIFQTTATIGRNQDELSGGGEAWEALVCWYLNLCMIGSRVVAVKTMSMVPESIRDSITVNYSNFACNKESDITIVVFPKAKDYEDDISQLMVTINSKSESFLKSKAMDKRVFNFLAERDFAKYEIGIVQCKTNWNDNAQIPMLWDMIYSSNGFKGNNITIGRRSFNLSHANNFTYSFVTVPSNSIASFQTTSTSVKRVLHLSGGNYWGHPSKPHVARSIKEIFSNNYANGSTLNFRDDIKNCLSELTNPSGGLSYFKLDF